MLDIFQIFLVLIIIILILWQKREAAGGSLFGSETFFSFKKRGLEKYIYYLTWVLIVVFIFVSLLKIS